MVGKPKPLIHKRLLPFATYMFSAEFNSLGQSPFPSWLLKPDMKVETAPSIERPLFQRFIPSLLSKKNYQNSVQHDTLYLINAH